MPDFSNAYFNGYGVWTYDPDPTYYSQYLVVRDIYNNSVLGTYNTLHSLRQFDSLGMCSQKLTIASWIGQPWRNNCAAYCDAGDPVAVPYSWGI